MVRRITAKHIKVVPDLWVASVSPKENFTGDIRKLKTIGLRLTRDQAVHLARLLLLAAQEWNVIEITAYRFKRRKSDGTYHVTVTTAVDIGQSKQEKN